MAQARRGQLISIDKANVLITSQLWREVVTALSAEYPDVTLSHELVDSFAMRLVREPATVDVVVAETLFGDHNEMPKFGPDKLGDDDVKALAALVTAQRS